MPFDLWTKSTEVPPVFEPERVPLPAFEQQYDATLTAAGYAASDRTIFIVEVDQNGRIVDDAVSIECARPSDAPASSDTAGKSTRGSALIPPPASSA